MNYIDDYKIDNIFDDSDRNNNVELITLGICLFIFIIYPILIKLLASDDDRKSVIIAPLEPAPGPIEPPTPNFESGIY